MNVDANEGVSWEARDLWSAPVEWSSHEMQEQWYSAEIVQPLGRSSARTSMASTSDGCTGPCRLAARCQTSETVAQCSLALQAQTVDTCGTVHTCETGVDQMLSSIPSGTGRITR